MADQTVLEGDILARLAEWQQGDFSLKCGDFLFRDLPETDEAGEADSGAVFDSEVEGFCVISQTCDVVRDPTTVAHVSVCPLVKIDQTRVIAVEKGIAPRYGILSNSPEGFVVDFSRVMSITKKLLVTLHRQRGCENDGEQTQFARAIEAFFGRYAFPDAFVESLRGFRSAVLEKHSKSSSDFGKAVRSIREIRVMPHASWSDLVSVPVTFVIILDEDGKRELEDRSKILSEIEPKVDGIVWIAPFCRDQQSIWLVTLNDITAADYLNSFPLDINSITFSKRYMNRKI